MNIGITLKKSAYTPEAYAYEKYLMLKGHKVQLDYIVDPNNDINIFFMGIRPFWKKNEGRAIEIHEYQSLSTPPYAHFKNFAKKRVNKQPSGRVFLNEFVHRDLNFSDNIPYIYRDMGVDEALFQSPSENPLYDIVYCGSIAGRNGLIEVIIKLAENYKVVVVGQVSDLERSLLKHENITILGRIERKDLPEIYRNARYGLNFTPNIYPYNIQTSTKTLEYLASGLGVISNKYKWSEQFFNEIDYQPVWLDDFDFLKTIEMNGRLIVSLPLIHRYAWENVLSDSKFDVFLREIRNENI
ncbi:MULTISPECIES: glycosyltransferase family protein [Acinetobacter]|uniref:glycosyltransferase family protein n=1 Tax=Acinetobacter TaxID=469 RepID=UPI00044F90FF|nr:MULTISPECIES: glycosyltransferase [Acinetobacter]EXB32978.1 glycosyl transferases group 1 family protein [Acinetobacter sp. 1461402]EXB72343.1 glycosyl transferases group 1 family protein [Acinetobacter sp. 230853]